MTLLLTHSTETPLPELPLPLHHYHGFILREGAAYWVIWGREYQYGPPTAFIKNFEFWDLHTAIAVRDALNLRCQFARMLMQ